jgi:hypothetical protein
MVSTDGWNKVEVDIVRSRRKKLVDKGVQNMLVEITVDPSSVNRLLDQRSKGRGCLPGLHLRVLWRLHCARCRWSRKPKTYRSH